MSEAKIEYCFVCDDATGNAGVHDDSLYLDDGTGPYCERCFEIRCLRAEVERLTRERDEERAGKCTGCGTARHEAIRMVAGGAAACCPDCSTLSVDDRNAIRAEVERLTEELETWTCRPFFPRGK